MQGTVDRVVADEGFGFIIRTKWRGVLFPPVPALKGVAWDESSGPVCR